jgi:hypothetical protein
MENHSPLISAVSDGLLHHKRSSGKWVRNFSVARTLRRFFISALNILLSYCKWELQLMTQMNYMLG